MAPAPFVSMTATGRRPSDRRAAPLPPYDVRRIFRDDVTPPSRRDLLSVLELARDVTAAEASDPFPLELLRRLGELVGVEVVGYCESPLPAGFGAYELVTRPQPAWLAEALEQSGGEDPVHARAWSGAVEPVAISDLLSARAFHRLRVYEDICEPLGVADSIRLYLPAPPGLTRYFFLDSRRRGFGERQRSLLRLLRPHLVLARRRHPGPRAAALLTNRERELLQLVALGLTNGEIARELVVSEHTVRTHLANVFAKLGVHTRTAAVAVGLQGGGPALRA
jgi:DNA-binding CsgD family transcriptional regulator